jgi:hypothetical protein
MANTMGMASAGAHVPFRGKMRSISKVPDELAAISVGIRNTQTRARMRIEAIFARIRGAMETFVCSPQERSWMSGDETDRRTPWIRTYVK